MEINATIIPFCFSVSILCLTRRSTSVNWWAVTDLKLMLTSYFITVGIFSFFPPLISSFVSFLLFSFLTETTKKYRIFMQWWLSSLQGCIKFMIWVKFFCSSVWLICFKWNLLDFILELTPFSCLSVVLSQYNLTSHSE